MIRGRAAGLVVAVVCAASIASMDVRAGESSVRPDGGRDFELNVGSASVPASWWYEPEPNGPGAVLLVASKEERERWLGVVRALRARGMNVLAVVAPQLAAKDSGPLPLVAPATLAAEGASFLVKNARCDPARVGVAGAGPAAVAALDCLRRFPGKFRAAVLAGPDLSRFQTSQVVAPTGKAVPPVLVMEHASSADPALATLVAEIAGSRRVEYTETVPGAEKGWERTVELVRGVPLGERTVASFLDARTGSADGVVLDGLVEDEAKPGGAWADAVAVGAGKVRAWARRSGKRLVFGGFASASAKAVRLDVAGVDLDDGGPSQKESEWFRRDLFDLRRGVLAWTARVPIVHADVQKLDVPPAIRAVPCDGGFTFEGEWTGTASVLSDGGRQGNHWRVLVTTLEKVPAAEKGDPSGNLAQMPVVAPR